MRQKIIATICLIIGVTMFCILTNNHFQNKTVLQFASWGSESEIRILNPILKDFEKENPEIKIDFLHIPQNYFQKIHLLFASNTSPDVIFINNQYLPIYAHAKVLEDLSPYTKDFELNKFYPKSIAALSYENKVYAIPRDISNLVIYYNKDIFDKYKVPYPKTNWTLENFLEISQKLTHAPEVFGISFEEEPLFYLPYLMSNGGEFVPKEKFLSKTSQESLQFYSDLRNKYHVAPLKTDSASATMAQMFLQKRLAMHLSGRWLVPKYRQEADFDWDIINFPNGTQGSVVPTDASGWAISKNSKHKKEAIKLIKYLSSKECSKQFTKSGLIVPARIDVANSKTFLDDQKPKNAQTFLTVIETSTPTTVTINYREVLDTIKTKTEHLFNK